MDFPIVRDELIKSDTVVYSSVSDLFGTLQEIDDAFVTEDTEEMTAWDEEYFASIPTLFEDGTWYWDHQLHLVVFHWSDEGVCLFIGIDEDDVGDRDHFYFITSCLFDNVLEDEPERFTELPVA